MKYPERIKMVEVGPRDGLQNEAAVISTEDKIAWIDQLSDTGLPYIEITSFVPPGRIPQLSDAVEVAKRIRRNPDIVYGALVPNRKGLERALEADIDEAAVFMSATESHNLANINKSIADTMPVLKETAAGALGAGKTVRGYVSMAFGCPYEGDVPIEQVFRVCDGLFEMGIRELSIGDTIGAASPAQVEAFLELALKRYSASSLALHFHDTSGMALANIITAMTYGISVFDASLGGLGGCPYAPGAGGNAATEDVVHMLEKMGIETGIHMGQLLKAAMFIQKKLDKKLPGRQTILYTDQT